MEGSIRADAALLRVRFLFLQFQSSLSSPFSSSLSPHLTSLSLSLFLCSSAVRSTLNARFPHSQQPSISQASSRSAPHCATHLSLLTSLLRSTPVSHFPLLVFFIFGVVYLEFLFWFCSDCRFLLLASADVFN